MFRLNNVYGTTAGNRGFETDNNKFLTDWTQYYHDIIEQNNNAGDFNISISDSYGGATRNMITTWLWTLIAAKLPEYDHQHFLPHKCYINIMPRTFSTEQANSEVYMAARDKVNRNCQEYGATPASRHDIDIVIIKKGQDALKYYHDNYAANEIPSISTLLTIDRYHKITVIRGTAGKITIVTTRWDEMATLRVIGLLPIFFPDIKTIVDADPTIYAILKALFDNDPDTIQKIMADTIKTYIEEAYKRNIDKLFTALETQKSRTIKQLENDVNSINNTIDDYLRSLAGKYEELEKRQRSLAGYLLNPFVIDENLHQFLEKSKNIRILNVNGDQNYMQMQFTTPIMNWNKQDVEMFFKHNPKVQQTYLNNPGWFAEIIRKIFIDEEYQIICTTTVSMPILNKGNSEDIWHTDHPHDDTFGNPHFTEYNCYRSSRNAYIQAISSNDYVRAISIILAATATLVFTDSAVINRMAAH
jgi:hypothetical protein